MASKKPTAKQREKVLNELYENAKAKGSVTYETIINELAKVEIDPEEFETILETIESFGVQVTREPEDENKLTEEDTEEEEICPWDCPGARRRASAHLLCQALSESQI